MRKSVLSFALLLVLASFAYAVPPQIIASGTTGSDGRPRANWDTALTAEVISLWIKIPSGEALDDGSARYAYLITYTSPDRKGVVKEGPFDFPENGIAKVFRPVSFFNSIKTRYYPRPNQGKWLVEFTLIDKGDKNQESKGGGFSFYLAGNDPAQIPTAGTGIVPPPPPKPAAPKVYTEKELKFMAAQATTTTTTLPPKPKYK